MVSQSGNAYRRVAKEVVDDVTDLQLPGFRVVDMQQTWSCDLKI